MTHRPGTTLLLAAGLLSSGVAALHVGILLCGASAYRYFGAGERMARMAERGSSEPAILTGALVLLFGAWAAYAFSGAGVIAPLPRLRALLPIIGLVYTARGLVAVPQLFLWLSAGSAGVPLRHLAFSTVSLVVGVTYVAGTSLAWRTMPVAQPGRSRPGYPHVSRERPNISVMIQAASESSPESGGRSNDQGDTPS